MLPDCAKAMERHMLHPDRYPPVMLSDDPSQPITMWADLTPKDCRALKDCNGLYVQSQFPGGQPLTLQTPVMDQMRAGITGWGIGDKPAEIISGLVPIVVVLLTLWLAWKVLGWPIRAAWRRQQAWEEHQDSLHGSARLARWDEYEAAGLIGKAARGLLIGKAGSNWKHSPVRYPGPAHLITFAPTGSGKGVSAVIPNLLDYEGSVVCIDPKGENAAITARRRRELGHEVHLLDPWQLAGQGTSSFNPLVWLDSGSEDFVEDAMMLADTLVIPGGHVHSHWDNEARALIAGVLMFIRVHEKPERRHLVRLYELLSLPAEKFEKLITAMMNSGHPAVAMAGARFNQKPEKEAGSVVSSAQENLHFLGGGRIAQVLSRSDFDLADLKRKKMTVYLILPADRLASQARWLRLMVSVMLGTMSREATIPAQPVLFMLDEFAALGRLQMVQTAMGLMRGFGLKLWPILQDISQLSGIYPEAWQTFIANAGVVQVFGANDIATAGYFSKMAGQTTVRTESTSQHGSTMGRTGRPLFQPDEIMRLSSQDQLLFVQGQPPAIVGRAIYYRMECFDGLHDPNPYLKP